MKLSTFRCRLAEYTIYCFMRLVEDRSPVKFISRLEPSASKIPV